MGKVLKGIDGERFPLIGGIAEYHVTFAESVDVETINDKEILWQVYWANEYSGYEEVPFSGQKTGRLTTYKFLQNLQGKNLQLKATYKNEAVELHITPQANGEIKIIDVFFLDVEYKMLDASNLKYLNSVNLQIYTLNMLGKYVEFKIYDTVNGRDVEVAKSSEPLKIVQTNGIVKTKRAILLSPAMYMQTQQDMSASEHHYKVKVWEKNDETNFYEEELKVKNELGQMTVPKDSQTPVKTGTSEPDKKKEEEKNEKCFCDRDFTVDEIKLIIESLRNSEPFVKKESGYTLFSKSSNIPNSDKTNLKFTEVLNKTLEKYNINTCIRKTHFLAQVYHETNRFRSSREEGGQSYLKSKNYYPFYGRGLMQLTWEGKIGSGHMGYKQYFDYLERTDYLVAYEQIDSNINLAFDSAGWFWEKGKALGNNKPGIWHAPNFGGDVGKAVGKENATVNKTIVKYGKSKTEYGVINLNLLADKDWVDTISWLVNGGGNGFNERREYLKKLKKIMNYEKCINKK